MFEGSCNRTWALVMIGPFPHYQTGALFFRQQWELRGLAPLRCENNMQNCSAKDSYIDGGRHYAFAAVFAESVQDTPLADLWWACGKQWGLRNTTRKLDREVC